MYKWLKNMLILLIALGVYYLVAYVVVVTTINSPAVTKAIDDYNQQQILAGHPELVTSPAEQIAASFQALFPVPIALTLIGILLSKWIQF
jgi:hypothetical protein